MKAWPTHKGPCKVAASSASREEVKRLRDNLVAFVASPDVDNGIVLEISRCFSVASSLKAASRLSESAELYQALLAAYDRAGSLVHANGDNINSDSLTCCEELGLLLEDLGRGKEALVYVRRALDIREQTAGPLAERTLTAVSNCAFLLKRLGNINEAERFCRRALLGFEQTLGKEHPHTLTSYNNLGSMLQDRGNLKEAEPLYRSALEGFEKTLSPEHSYTVNTLLNIAILLNSQGKKEEAEPFYRQVGVSEVP